MLKICVFAAQVKGELNMACCWRVTPLDSVAIKARSLTAEVAQKQDMLALLAEQTLDCSSVLPLRGSSSVSNLQSLMGRKGLLKVKVRGLHAGGTCCNDKWACELLVMACMPSCSHRENCE